MTLFLTILCILLARASLKDNERGLVVFALIAAKFSALQTLFSASIYCLMTPI